MELRHTLLAVAASAALVASCAACTSSSGGAGTAVSSTATSPAVSTSVSSGASTSVSTPATPSTSTTPVTSPSTKASTPAAAAHPEWCVDGEVTVGETANPEGGAAGHNSVVLTFTNSSTRTCSLFGYPGADALNSSGKVVAHATRSLTGYIGGSYSGLHEISLHPGQVASTILEGDIGDGGPDCSSGVKLVVTAPNLFHSSPVTGAPYVCMFVIHPVVAGNTGR